MLDNSPLTSHYLLMNSLGKYGQYPDCVDFDPSHEINAKAESEMPNFSQLQSEIGDFFKSIGKMFANN